MQFIPTGIDGLWVVRIKRLRDARGFFVRTFCRNEFAAQGLDASFVQASNSFSQRAGTLRGMHYQREPHAEAKLVRCVRGSIHDVVADLRPHSPTYMQVAAFRLAAKESASLYIPPGCAHGFQVMEPETEVAYHMTAEYAPEYADGFRFDDPSFPIVWPLRITAISERDLSWPAYVPAAPEGGMRRARARMAPTMTPTLINDAVP